MQFTRKFEFLPKRAILNIGIWKKEVEVRLSNDLDEQTIGLSKYISKDFWIPDTLSYEVKMKNRNIYIGPLIAFLLESKKKYISEKRLEKLKDYYINYHNIKGIIFICAVDQIDNFHKIINGYYYNGLKWMEGTFPYPGCIYRKTDIPLNIYNNLTNCMGDRIFNSYFFDKWETWKLLSPFPSVNKHLPHTERLEGIEGLDNMLNLYESAYLKQAKGYKAKGIIKAERSEKDYHFTYRLKGTKTFGHRKEADKFLKELNEQKRGKNYYIIQEAIKIKKYQNRSFDFRVILQKGQNMQWGCTGIIARFGKRNSIATNFLLAGYALTGHEALKRVFRMNEKEAFLMRQEIIDICVDTSKLLDKIVGNYGDLGIDVMVDKNKKVWILEINKTHDHRFPLYSVNNTTMYHEVISKPFEYAKTLAGF